MTSKTSISTQCRFEVEVYSFGRNVAEMKQCRRQTRDASGYCHQHRGDWHNEQ